MTFVIPWFENLERQQQKLMGKCPGLGCLEIFLDPWEIEQWILAPQKRDLERVRRECGLLSETQRARGRFQKGKRCPPARSPDAECPARVTQSGMSFLCGNLGWTHDLL
jgi:hypothetical protein